MLSKYEVYPEEFSNVVTITMIAQVPGNFIIALVDIKTSKIIRMVGAEVKEGANTVQFEGLQDLPASEYQVTIQHNDGDEVYTSFLRKNK